MADDVHDDTLLHIEDKIRALANAALSTGRPLLLSALGKDLGDDLKELKVLTGGGLSRFIQDRLPDEFAIVLGGEHRNVQAIVRAGSIDLAEGGAYEDLTQAQLRSPRYHYKFWAAFSVPLSDGKHRLIDLSTFGFEDVEAAEERSGWKVITENFIASVNAADRDRLISLNIERWLKDSGESQSRFLNATRSRPEKISRQFEAATLLDLLIQSLDSKQLSSTMMSLDTVSALLKKRI